MWSKWLHNPTLLLHKECKTLCNHYNALTQLALFVLSVLVFFIKKQCRLNVTDEMISCYSVGPFQGALVSHVDKLVHYLSDTTLSVDCSGVWCFPSRGRGKSVLEWRERPWPDTQTLLFQCSSPLAKKLSAHILSFRSHSIFSLSPSFLVGSCSLTVPRLPLYTWQWHRPDVRCW